MASLFVLSRELGNAGRHKESTANQRGGWDQTGDDTRIHHSPVLMNIDDCIYWNICQSHLWILNANLQHKGGSLNSPSGYLWIQGDWKMCCKQNGQFFFFYHLCLLVTVKKKSLQNFPIQETHWWVKKVWVAFQRKHGTRAVCIEATKAVLWEWCKIIKVFIPA